MITNATQEIHYIYILNNQNKFKFGLFVIWGFGGVEFGFHFSIKSWVLRKPA